MSPAVGFLAIYRLEPGVWWFKTTAKTAFGLSRSFPQRSGSLWANGRQQY
ncbi:hypothetical protein [Lactiplantibacillus mudanjiangensis]|nr:hypothetical protein [Lactiplantibacillus mudanjiangensis]